MRDNYPPGADTKDAPWNQDDRPCRGCATIRLRAALIGALEDIDVYDETYRDDVDAIVAKAADDLDAGPPCRDHRTTREDYL